MSERTVRTHWFWYLPSVLLLIVAANPLRLVSAAALSPWWGGGFGMFAITGGWATRHLHVFAIRPTLKKEVEQALTLPSHANLQEVKI